MNPVQKIIKLDPSLNEQPICVGPFHIVPNTLSTTSQYQPLVMQSQPIPSPVLTQLVMPEHTNNPYTCTLVVNEANLPNQTSRPSLTVSKEEENVPVYQSKASSSELGRIVRPASPTQQCMISADDESHIGHMLKEMDMINLTAGERICALSSKSLYVSNAGALISTIDIPYYWCNFCPFKTEQKLLLLKHLMSHRFICKFCRFQSYTRSEVVLHTISAHKKNSDDLKSYTLLPDYLRSQLYKENDTNKENTGTKENGDKSVDHEKNDNITNSGVDISPETSNAHKSSSGLKSIEKTLVKTYKSKQNIPETNKSDEIKNAESPQKNENETTNSHDDFGVCFQCCTCGLRTVHKELIEKHLAEANHHKTDSTTGKKPYILKIINASEKLKLEQTDKVWLLEDNKSARRSQRRSKPEFCKLFNNGDCFDDEDNDWSGYDDDDDDDEDYLPAVQKGTKKRKLNHSSKNTAKSSFSDVSIEIDTASEPSEDIGVRSYSISCLNVTTDNPINVSPKKIVARDIYQNCLINVENESPMVIKKEQDTDQGMLYDVTPKSKEIICRPDVIMTTTANLNLVSSTTGVMSSSMTTRSALHSALKPISSVNPPVLPPVVSKTLATPAVSKSSTLQTSKTTSQIPSKTTASGCTTSSGSKNSVTKTTSAMSKSSALSTSKNTSQIPSKTTASRRTTSSVSKTSVTRTASAVSKSSTLPASKTTLIPSKTTTSGCTSPTSTTPVSGQSKSKKKKSSPVAKARVSDIDTETKGNYKCAHCRITVEKVMLLRSHILDKHKETPLYCLNMDRAEDDSAKYMLFCHFKDCKFVTGNRSDFLSHVDTCKNSKEELSDADKKLQEINFNFVSVTFPKLIMLTK